MIRRRGAPKIEPVEDVTEKPRGFDDYEVRLGDVMRGERATLGKSLLDVQRELKIKATYIAAIENSDPTAFETPGFVAGYEKDQIARPQAFARDMVPKLRLLRSRARKPDSEPLWRHRATGKPGGSK